ncbi:MAG: YggT family protein [Acidimicrobiia bacterium]|nr:YggT family protein [Acidimicrobiia bacterium]
MAYNSGEQAGYWRSTSKVAVLVARAIAYLVYFYLVVVEIILSLGFFLLLFGANPSSGFAQWIYRSLDRSMEPFRGIFTPVELGTTAGNEIKSVFDTSVLFAMIIYGILAVAIYSLVTWLTYRLDRLEREEQVASLIEETAASRSATAGVPGPMPAASDVGGPPSGSG